MKNMKLNKLNIICSEGNEKSIALRKNAQKLMSRNRKIEVPFFLPAIDEILLLKKKSSKEKPICESNKNFVARIHGILDEICKSLSVFCKKLYSNLRGHY